MKFNITALAYATIGVIWLIVAMTIGSEQSKSFKDLLASIGGHHWVGKSIVSAVSLFVLYLIMRSRRESTNGFALMLAVCASAIAGGIVIFLFFVSHFLAG